MKKGMALPELAAQIKRERAEKRDFIAHTNRLQMREDGAIHLEVSGNAYDAVPTQHCLRQIGARVGIPSKYLERLSDGHKELLAQNVNHWFQQQPEKRMLRTLMNGQHIARAFLSDRYRPLDNHDLAEAVLPKLAKAGCEVLSSQITETRLYIQAATPRLQLDLAKFKREGRKLSEVDPVQAGAVISNSEVGCGAIQIEPMLWKLGCFNGMILPMAMRRHHVGRSIFAELEEASEFFSDSTRQLDDRAFWAKVIDVVDATFDKDGFETLVKKFGEAQNVRIDNTVDAIEEITDRFQLKEDESKSVLNHLIEGGDTSLFGLINAVTRTSTDVESYDRAVELERVGGDILELPQTLWSKN